MSVGADEDEPKVERLTARVHGFVQGVGYRDYCMSVAAGIGRLEGRTISGYARNMPNGSMVEVLAEGPRPLQERLLRELHQGPRIAEVVKVEASWGAASREFDGFRWR